MDVIARIGMDRLGLLAAPSGKVTPALATAALAELARVGLRVANPEAMSDALAAQVPDVVAHERTRRGQHGTYTPLFAGFPDQLPTVDDIALRALLGAVRLAGVDEPDEEQVREAYDFSAVGWWPASSLPQDVPATLLAREHQKTLATDTVASWVTLTLVRPEQLPARVRDWMADAFAAPTSLRADVRADLADAVRELGVQHIDPTTVRFRETRTLLARLVWDTDRPAVATLGLTPDDLLRLFADLGGYDVSLSTPITFPHLSHADRRIVVRALEASDRLSDVFRRRGLWLALARGLHVGTFADAPRTREVFTRLRATRHDHLALTSQFETALAVDLPAAVKLAADQAPGVLGRQVRRLASLAAGDPVSLDALCAALDEAGPRIPLRVLLAARAQIGDNGTTYPRVVFLPSGKALTIDRPVGHLQVPAHVRTRLLGVLGAAVDAQLAARDSWAGQRVHVAPGLDRVLVPEALRSTLPGLIQVERGSALPVGDAPVVRLFVHWKAADSDLDLSCLALGENFEVLEQVSWTHLRSAAMVHSGDITSAPAGAEEFIDIDLAAARTMADQFGWRYLAPAIFRFSGPAFAELQEAVAGWMLREHTSTDRVAFDPATVAGAFALGGRGRTAVPFVLDLLTSELVYVDVYRAGEPGARTERDGSSIGSLARAVVARRSTRTDVASLVAAHVAARGGVLVDDPAQATITVGTQPGCTYDVLRPEKFLADLL